jgi:hypothetical protein
MWDYDNACKAPIAVLTLKEAAIFQGNIHIKLWFF